MSTSTINMEERKPLIDQLIFERRVLLGCTALIGVAIIIWITAVSTDSWYVVKGGYGIHVPSKNRYFVKSQSGLWKSCRSVLNIPKDNTTTTTPTPPNGTTKIETGPNTTHDPGPPSSITTNTTTASKNSTDASRKIAPAPPPRLDAETAAKLQPYVICKYIEIFPKENVKNSSASVDSVILHHNRTEVSFAIISMFVMCMGFGFSIYTFLNPRYMFKRLAGGIHFISAATVMVVIQVFISSIDYLKQMNVNIYPKSADQSYGFSLYLAWIVLIINVFSGLSFMIYSRKRKGNKAATEELGMADEAINIGR